MPNMTNNYKTALIIQTYLIMVKEPVTSKNISDFINTHDFPLHQKPSPEKVAGIIKKYRYQAGNSKILSKLVVYDDGHLKRYIIP